MLDLKSVVFHAFAGSPHARRQRWTILVALAVLSLLALGGTWARFRLSIAAWPRMPTEVAWQHHQQSFILKDKEVRFSFSYPEGWVVIAHPDGYLVHVQNIPPFDNPADVPGGLSEGFVKISFMLDPRADPGKLSGESVLIHGIPWKQRIDSGGIAGDQSLTLETVRDGVVFRIYAYIMGTGVKGPLFERHLATLTQMVSSLAFEPTVPLERPPDAPPLPENGKPGMP